MKSPLLTVLATIATLFIAVFAYEFRLGLGHYAPFRYGDVVARISTEGRDALDEIRLVNLHAHPSLEAAPPLRVPVHRGELTLVFDTLHQGFFGALLGLQTVTKLSRIEYGDRDGTLVRHPLNGGTDLCFQLLELSGSLGALIANVRHHQVTLPPEDGPWAYELRQRGRDLEVHRSP